MVLQKNLELLENSEKIGFSTRDEAMNEAKRQFDSPFPEPKKWIKYGHKNKNIIQRLWYKLWGTHQKKWREWAKTGNFGD